MGIREIDSRGNDVTSMEAYELAPGEHSVIVEKGIACRHGSESGGYASAAFGGSALSWIAGDLAVGVGIVPAIRATYHALTDSETLKIDFKADAGKNYFVVCPTDPPSGVPWGLIVSEDDL